MRVFLLYIALLAWGVKSQGQDFQPKHPITQSHEIAAAIEKLDVLGSVLYIAAHPDDENTRLLTYLARGKKVQTAYLSLTRGDGGQNLIGSEQGPELGLLRTQELLEARKVDGAYQFFTRAKDFGYSKNPEETLEIWNQDEILSDMVWVIRLFRPDIIITRFPTTGEGGHGHHTASAILAEKAFDLAASSTAFPEQLAYVKPWQCKRLLWNSFSWNRKPGETFDGEIPIMVGDFDPRLGRSFGEIASLARSKHRCQGFGSRLIRGESTEYLKNIKGTAIKQDLFEDLPLSWSQFPEGSKISNLIQQIAKEFQAQAPDQSLAKLFELKKIIMAQPNEHWRKVKLDELNEIILTCTGFYADAYTQVKHLVPGQNLPFVLECINRSSSPLSLIQYSLLKQNKPLNKTLSKNKLLSLTDSLFVPANFPISQANWLVAPYEKGVYPPAHALKVHQAQNEAPFNLELKLQILNDTLLITIPIQHKEIDPSLGEVYNPLPVLCPVAIQSPFTHYMAQNGKCKVSIELECLTDSIRGELEIKLPKGVKSTWLKKRIELQKQGQKETLEFELSGISQEIKVELNFKSNGQSYNSGFRQIKYPHIESQTWFPPASLVVHPVEISGNEGLIGYIPGAGDEIPAYLSQIGFQVEELKAEQLASGDLQKYKAIICGIRAYNINESFKIWQDHLNRYVADGGTYIVQYQTQNFIGGVKHPLAPKKLVLGRERTTREEAPVKLLQAEHPALLSPNKISTTDFDNWIQERGIYFASEWDPAFIPLVEMNDPNEKAQLGSLLYLSYGKGHYVYTGLAFFRQIPAGVPGAYRLLTNLINLSSKQSSAQ